MREAPMMGTARLDGWIASGSVPRVDVERWLPAGTRLADSAWASTDLHPIICICGGLTQTTILFGGLTIPTGVDYREFAILVPLVRHSNGRQYAFVLQMYSSVPTAVLAGNAYYGFAKQQASISRQGPAWSVIDADGAIVAHAAFQLCPQAATDLMVVRSLLSLPLLGRKADGSVIASRFEWDFDAAGVRPGASRIVLAGSFLGDKRLIECGSIAAGSFQVTALNWRLSWPRNLEIC